MGRWPWALGVLLATACHRGPEPVAVPAYARPIEDPDAPGYVSGIVRDRSTGGPLARVTVTLTCDCRDGAREVLTNDAGLFKFNALPPGVYTAHVHYQRSDVARTFELRGGEKWRANLLIDPNDPTPHHSTVVRGSDPRDRAGR
jgi:Carboxypeptidase regulatory-like domain